MQLASTQEHIVHVDRLMLTDQSQELLALTRDVIEAEIRPRRNEAERTRTFPRDAFRVLGHAGLLGLPYPVVAGGGGQSYYVYLQLLEELASAWSSVGLGAGVHALSGFGLAHGGTPLQQEQWLPELLAGKLLGAYCLLEGYGRPSEPVLRPEARRRGDEYVLSGATALTTYGDRADFYTVSARTSGSGGCEMASFLVPADTNGLRHDEDGFMTALMGSTTSTVFFDDVRVPVERRIGHANQGVRLARAGLDASRLCIAAIATGVAQSALSTTANHLAHGSPVGSLADHRLALSVLGDMAAAVDSARATYLVAARHKDAGLSIRRKSAMAKLTATDHAAQVIKDALQLLRSAGRVAEMAVERLSQEGAVMRMFGATSHRQRLLIGRELAVGLS